jgi:hypothetical protein
MVMTIHSKRNSGASKSGHELRLTGELRLFWIAFNVALEPDVFELLDSLEVTAYTRWDNIKGNGHSGPHLNDEVWPAVNALVMFAADAGLEADLAQGVAAVRRHFPGEGIKLIVQPCSAIY